MKQFFYTRKEVIPQPEGEAVVNEYLDSFNVDLVIRSFVVSDGRRLVILNDFHEELRQVPQLNKKGEVVSYKNERSVYNSDIYLEPKDSERFVKLLNQDI